MDNIEVDLIDGDGAIVSVAQADPNVWVAIAAQSNQLAAQDGFSLQTGPLFNQPERTLDSFPAVQNWLATQSSVQAVRAAKASAFPAFAVVGVAVAVAGVAALVLVAQHRRRAA